MSLEDTPQIDESEIPEQAKTMKLTIQGANITDEGKYSIGTFLGRAGVEDIVWFNEHGKCEITFVLPENRQHIAGAIRSLKLRSPRIADAEITYT